VQLLDLARERAAPRWMVLRGHEGGVADGTFSPDGNWLVIGEHKGTARLWNLRSKGPAFQSVVLRGHSGSVIHFAFPPDGHWLVTASDHPLDAARVWDLKAADPSARNVPLRGAGWGVVEMVIGPDSRWLAVRHRDHSVRLWDLRRYHPGSSRFHDW
jgi:WD40 repeat protein